MQLAHRMQQVMRHIFVGPAIPVGKIDGLELAETQRGNAAVDGNRDETIALAPAHGFVANPVRCDRYLGPQDHHCLGALERLLGGFHIGHAGRELPIPPDGKTGIFQQGDDRLGEVLVFARIADEYGGRFRRCPGLMVHLWSVTRHAGPLHGPYAPDRCSSRTAQAKVPPIMLGLNPHAGREMRFPLKTACQFSSSSSTISSTA